MNFTETKRLGNGTHPRKLKEKRWSVPTQILIETHSVGTAALARIKTYTEYSIDCSWHIHTVKILMSFSQ